MSGNLLHFSNSVIWISGLQCFSGCLCEAFPWAIPMLGALTNTMILPITKMELNNNHQCENTLKRGSLNERIGPVVGSLSSWPIDE